MSATDELRRLLDERGVEWFESVTRKGLTWIYRDGKAIRFHPWQPDTLKVSMFDLTPEQAIAATLGSEDTYTREDVEGAFVSGYSLGLDMFDSSKQEKGWNQNKRNMDEEMEDLGWVRKDAATLGAGTCKLVETEHEQEIADEFGKGTFSYWAYDCSECGHENAEYGRFCAGCGRKVVDE